MPSSKIVSVFILCLALVISTWLFSKNYSISTSTLTNNQPNAESLSARPYIESGQDEEWKKLLSKIEPKDQVFTDLTKNNPNTFDDTTITAQVAKDFFSQYLLLKKGGADLTQENIAQIAQNISSTPEYTQVPAARYVAKNLIIIPTNTENLKKYKNNVNLSLKTRSAQIKDDPILIITEALRTDDEKVLNRLDPIIISAKSLIDDFLKMNVPESAMMVHLAMLNAFSNGLTDLEAFRSTTIDPVKALASIGQYNKHLQDFDMALQSMNAFLSR